MVAGPTAAFAAAGLDGIRPAQSVALVPLVAGGLHASALADRLRVSRQAVAQAVAALERHGYVRGELRETLKMLLAGEAAATDE